jgi:hypothetical protein
MMTEPTTDRRSWVREYALGLVLGGLFLASWLAQFVFQAQEAVNESNTHGEAFSWSEFWPKFLSSTFENWQSEFLQLLSFVVLTTYFIYKGSHESRDGQDRMEAKIDRILEAVETE